MKIVIIGGGTAGTTTAFEIRKHDKDAEVVVIEKTSNTQCSPCSMPYYVEGKIQDKKDLIVFSEQDYRKAGIDLLLETEVESIDHHRKTLQILTAKNDKRQLSYDALVLATGASPIIPPIDGLDKVNSICFKTLDDAVKLKQGLQEYSKISILGAGFIGVEVAWALKDNNVSLIEAQEHILPGAFDNITAKTIQSYLENNGVVVETGKNISDASKIVQGKDEMVILSCGVKPNINVAEKAGAKVNKGILVNSLLETSLPSVYACGDCCEFTDKSDFAMSQLGTSAVKQAGILVNNILNEEKQSFQTNNSIVSMTGELVFGATGLSREKAGREVVTSFYKGSTKSRHFPGAKDVRVWLVADSNGKLLGGQVVGYEGVVGRVNLVSLAVQKDLNLKDLAVMDACYNPSVSPIFEPVAMAAEMGLRKIRK